MTTTIMMQHTICMKKLERRKNRKIYGSDFVGVVGGAVLNFLGV